MTAQNELKNTVFHTAMIGAGASGLMCAGSFERPKIIIEHNAKPGAKVSVSGGGNCNFSNRFVSATDYLCQNKHFCKNALAAFRPQDFLRLLEEHHIAWEERSNGQLFAFGAQHIVRLLVRRAQAAHTQILTNTQALDVRRENGLFVIDTSEGPVRAQYLVLACGERFKPLAGNSLPATASCGKHAFTDHLLFTHEGISGPAVLQTSLYWTAGQTVTVNFLPGEDALAFLHTQKNSAKTFASALHGKLSAKVVKTLLAGLPQDLPNASRLTLEEAARRLNRFSFIPAGTAGYTRAEVTAGGVDTKEINPSTFEARRVPGLYIIGELLDVTGRLGGFNLHWAWSSGFAAAKALEKKF